MSDGDIVKWLVKEGDRVSKGDKIVHIETSKVDVELEAPAGGTIRKILVGEGENVKTGTVIALIGEPTERIPNVP